MCIRDSLQLVHQLVNEIEAFGVQLAVGFIDERKLRLLCQESCKSQTFSHARGVEAYGVRARFESDLLEQFFRVFGVSCERTDDVQVFGAGEVLIERGLVREERDFFPHLLAVSLRFEPKESERSEAAGKGCGQDSKQGGFATSVATDNQETFTL